MIESNNFSPPVASSNKNRTGLIVFFAIVLVVGFFLFYVVVSFLSGLAETWTVFLIRFALVVISAVLFGRTIHKAQQGIKLPSRKIIYYLTTFFLIGSFISVAISSKDYLPIPDRLDPNLVLSVHGDKTKIRNFFDFQVAYLVQAEQYWMIETDEKTITEIADFFGLEPGTPEGIVILGRAPAWWPKSLPANAKVYRAKPEWQRLNDGNLIFYMIWDPKSGKAYASVV